MPYTFKRTVFPLKFVSSTKVGMATGRMCAHAHNMVFNKTIVIFILNFQLLFTNIFILPDLSSVTKELQGHEATYRYIEKHTQVYETTSRATVGSWCMVQVHRVDLFKGNRRAFSFFLGVQYLVFIRLFMKHLLLHWLIPFSCKRN